MTEVSVCRVTVVQHCDTKSHRDMIAERSFYQSLDDLIAAGGLQLTTDKFLPAASTEPTQNRHDVVFIAATKSLSLSLAHLW